MMKWISVKDKLPEFNKDVLVWLSENQCPEISCLYKYNRWFCNLSEDYRDDDTYCTQPLEWVSHWMEIEEPKNSKNS